MTTASSILNADMATLGRWLRAGTVWWLAELAALLPARWRRGGGPMLRLDADGGVIGTAPPPGSRPLLLVPAAQALVRPALLPDLPDDALWRTVDAEAARLLPVAPAALLLARRIVARDNGNVTVELAGLPIAAATPLLDTIRRLGVTPARVTLADAGGGAQAGFDFLPALRQRGLLPPASQQPLLAWAMVVFLVLLTVAVAVWRDIAATDAMAELVAEQQPAVVQLQRLQRRIARLDTLAASAAQRRSRQPLALLGRVAARLPAGAFLVRFDIEGDALRLSGYKPAGGNIITALRADPGLAEIRAVRSEGGDLVGGLQPFDISARVIG